MAEMQSVFLEFCSAVNKDSTLCTAKTLKKIATDCKLTCPRMDQNRIDIEFSRFLGPKDKSCDYNGFVRFVEGYLAEAYAAATNKDHDAAVSALKKKICSGKPGGHGTTSISKDNATARLTDVKGYTGAHKERFDQETGKGKGKEGRENTIGKKAQEGYVGNYRDMNTYDKKH